MRVVCGLLVVFAVVIAGCGDSPKLKEATGVVTMDGKPVADASVIFVNSDEGGFPATATTDAEGKFSLKTYWNASKKTLSGAIPGKYRVTVTKSVEPTQEEVDEAMKKSREVKTKQLLPVKYSKVGSTPLEHTVTDSGENDFEIELSP